jgi:FO synthase
MIEFFPKQDVVHCISNELDAVPVEGLMDRARALRAEGHGRLISFSPKVFMPLTRLCRDFCGYCTFAHPPRPGGHAFLTIDEVLAIARAGVAVGCTEALFRLGELPEQRYGVARGYFSAVDYLADACKQVLDQTGLLPHINPGIISSNEMAKPRRVSASQRMMLESTLEGRIASRLGRQGATDTDRDAGGGWAAFDSLHDRDFDRDRRDA